MGILYWVDKILGDKINRSVLWIKESKVRLIFVLFLILIFFVWIIPQVFIITATINIVELFQNSYAYIYGIQNSNLYILCLSIIVLAILHVLWNKIYKTNIVHIHPHKHPYFWSFFRNEIGWSLVTDNQSFYKVLKVSRMWYPTILKFGNDWINYELSFKVKVPKQDDTHRQHEHFSFVIRAKDKVNNIFFQCLPSGKIRPHLLINGLFIIDDTNIIESLAEYPIGEWIEVRARIIGNEVQIIMQGVKSTYTIPSESFDVNINDITSNAINLSRLRDLARNISDEESRSHQSTILIALDFEKGTIGFRQHGYETALFKQIKVKILNTGNIIYNN